MKSQSKPQSKSQSSEKTIYTMVSIALMTALMCIFSPFTIPIPVSLVPLSLATFVLYIMAYILNPIQGVTSCFIYLFLGFIGLPVFSGFSGGFGKLAGPTGGYLIGYLFLIFISSWFIHHFHMHKLWSSIGMVIGTAALYLFGTIWLAKMAKLSFLAALAAGVLPYLIGDIIKIITASILGPLLKRAISQ